MTLPRRPRALVPVLAAALVLAVLLGGAALVFFNFVAPIHAQRGGRASEALVVDGPLVLLPAFAETPNSRDVSGLLYRGLTRTGPGGKPTGELARSWSVDAAARVFTFHLRPGLRWSDGAPITSADAQYTLGVLQSDADARSTAGQAWGGITATTPDPLTVVFTLPQSSPAFLSLTSIGLLPQHVLQPRGLRSLRTTTDAPTSGPFVVALVARDHLLLRRNPQAFEPPYLDELDLRLYDSRPRAVQALVSGEVDIYDGLAPDDARRVAATVNRRVVRGSTFAYAELLLNQKSDALADDHVRRAVGLAINRRNLVTSGLGGYGRLDETPVPPALPWAVLPGHPQAFDPAAAARELDGAGYRLSGHSRTRDGKALKLRLTAPTGIPYNTVVQEIERDLAAVGIGTSTQSLAPENLLSQLQSHQFDLALTALDNGSDPDFYVFWHSSQAGPGGFNFSGMTADPVLDKDLEDGRSTADYAHRAAAYADAQKRVLAAHAAVFLYTPDLLLGARDALGGVTLPAGGQRYDRVQDWFVSFYRGL